MIVMDSVLQRVNILTIKDMMIVRYVEVMDLMNLIVVVMVS